jgi:hypothetical protein
MTSHDGYDTLPMLTFLLREAGWIVDYRHGMLTIAIPHDDDIDEIRITTEVAEDGAPIWWIGAYLDSRPDEPIWDLDVSCDAIATMFSLRWWNDGVSSATEPLIMMGRDDMEEWLGRR